MVHKQLNSRLRGCADRWVPVVAVGVSTPDRTSKSLVRSSNSILGGRAFTQVRSYPAHALRTHGHVRGFVPPLPETLRQYL